MNIPIQAHAKLYVTAIACLAYGLSQYNEMVRCTVAGAGNDHRLGAQEAPPAIISLCLSLGGWVGGGWLEIRCFLSVCYKIEYKCATFVFWGSVL